MNKMLVEKLRTALMKQHSEDWTMEVISEAAHICAEAIQPSASTRLMHGDTPEKAKQRYKTNGFGIYGSPSAKKTYDTYMQLFTKEPYDDQR